MPIQEWFLDPFNLACFLSLEIVLATTVFWRLRVYNQKTEKRVRTAHACNSRQPNGSLFELPAFRLKTNSTPTPFENTTWLPTLYEQIKVSIMAVTLFPSRFIASLFVFFGSCLVVYVLQNCCRMQSAAKLFTKLTGRVLLFCFGFLRITVKGSPAPGVGVLVSNHHCFLDGLIWVAISTPRIFAEKANFSSPFMKVFAEALDIVLFDRSGAESRRAARETMAKSAQQAFEGKKNPILVFPTGTTTNSQVLITFKDGAFAPGLPVQPAVLRFKFKHCDPCWVFSGPGTLMLVFRLMCQIYNALEVEFLPVHVPTEEEKKEPFKFARSVQLEMADAMGVPVTEHSVEDLQLQLAAVKVNLPAEVGVVGFAGLKDVFSVDANLVKKQLHVFKEMDKEGAGLWRFEEFKASFRRGFHEPSAEQTKLLQDFFFQLTGGSEYLDFRKFLIGLALVNENEKAQVADGDKSSPRKSSTTLPVAEIREKIYSQLAFAAFASESDDRISWDEFRELWTWLHPDVPVSQADKDTQAATGDKSFSTRRKTISRLASLVGYGVNADDESCAARLVFDKIAGGRTRTDRLTWDQFSTYADKHPVFVRDLRGAFFSRIATDLSAK